MAILKFRIYFEEDDSVYRDVAIKHTQSFNELHGAHPERIRIRFKASGILFTEATIAGSVEGKYPSINTTVTIKWLLC